MRSHGLPDFPDPGSNGGFQISGGPGTPLDPNSTQYASAYAACKSLMPPLRTRGGQHPDRAHMLRYAQCMRAQGVKDFPDPDPQGGLTLSGSGDLNPSSPLFQKAQNACKRFQPGGGGGVTSRSHP